MLSADGIGPIIEGLQNHTEEINQRLDDLGIGEPDRQIIINALLVLNDQCRVVGIYMYVLYYTYCVIIIATLSCDNLSPTTPSAYI